MVNQNIKQLGITYGARIQIDMFEELFKDRVAGSGAKIPKALEAAFLVNPKTAAEKRIERFIREFNENESTRLQKDLFAQTKRLADAERTLLTKVTKKAQNDQRVASEKIENLKFKLQNLNSPELKDSDSRIYPGQYAPLIIELEGEKVIAPFRYLLRPKGQAPDFDRKFMGCYNARRDSLKKVFWWKSVFGRNHGAMEINGFWENVKLHHYENRKLKKDEEEKNIILKFEPRSLDHLLVPCIFDFNNEGEFPLQSFALITDEPNPEVAAAGHDRTPIIMKDENLDLWIKTKNKALNEFEIVFNDKQSTYFEHRVAA